MLSAGMVEQARAKLTEWSVEVSHSVVEDWWKLLEFLFTRYNNGMRIDDWHQDVFAPTALFYPFYWLQHVGYWPEGLDLEAIAPSNTRRTIAGALDITPIPPEKAKPSFVRSNAESRIALAPTSEFSAADLPPVLLETADTSATSVQQQQHPAGGVRGFGLFLLVAAVYGAGVLTGRVWGKLKRSDYEPLGSDF